MQQRGLLDYRIIDIFAAFVEAGRLISVELLQTVQGQVKIRHRHFRQVDTASLTVISQ